MRTTTPQSVFFERLLDLTDSFCVLFEFIAEGVRTENNSHSPSNQFSDHLRRHGQRMKHRLVYMSAPSRGVQDCCTSLRGQFSCYLNGLQLRSTDDFEFLRRNCHAMCAVPFGSGLASGENAVVHRMCRVIRRRLIGIAVTKVHMGVLLMSDHFAIARRSVDVEHCTQ